MKKILPVLLMLSLTIVYGQQSYYNGVDFTKSGQDLYFELQNKIDNASSSYTYGDVRDSFLIMDEDPDNSNNVLLIYGYNDTDGNCTTDRSRDKDDFGGTSCEYNREHTFARSLANPSMGSVDNGTTGIGADPHNIRPSDQQMNNNKGNKKFGDGSGNAGNVGSGNWYPGDEWKGDVARIIMYMYVRYGNRCLPEYAGVGPKQGTTDMLQMFLEWNAEDPVSDLEDQRNPHLQGVYGNRNPFIDNPYLATRIWGGVAAEDRWELFSIEDNFTTSVTVVPNPASDYVFISNSTNAEMNITFFDVLGREVFSVVAASKEGINTASLKRGVYLVKIASENASVVKKLILQ